GEAGGAPGERGMELARRGGHLNWGPSKIFDSNQKSPAAGRAQSGLKNLKPPQRINLLDPDWTWIGGGPLAAMLCINVLHISPWTVSRNLMSGAGKLLKEDGRLSVY